MVKFTQNSTEKQNPAMFPALSPTITLQRWQATMKLMGGEDCL